MRKPKTYTIYIPTKAGKVLRAIPERLRIRIIEKIGALAANPYPDGVVKIQGTESLYRIRMGEYRIIYRVDDGELVILVVKVGHRSEVYRAI